VVIASALVAAVGIVWTSWNCLNAEFAWIRADAALARGGDAEVAWDFAESGLQANPNHSALAATGGRASLILGKQTQFSESERRRFLERSAELSLMASKGDPGDAWNLINLAHAYDNFGNFEQAAPLHMAAIAKAPYYATPYEFYALHLELSGSPTEAVRFYELALNLPESTFSAQRRDALLKNSSFAPFR
jgi:tetratricopeptide (TPR) repeat protein